MVGGHPRVLSFRRPPIAADALVGEAVLIAEDQLLSLVGVVHDPLSALKSSFLVEV